MPSIAGYVCAILGGIAFMAIAGAPKPYLAVNLAALVVGLAIVGIGRARDIGDSRRARAIVLILAPVLLAASFAGPQVDGVHRWLRIGPIDLHAGMIVIPALAVAAQRSASWMALVASALVALRIAFQPDRASAAALVGMSLAILYARRDRWSVASVIVALASLGWTSVAPEGPSPVRFVENVLADAMALHPLAAVLLSALLIAAIVPLGHGWRSVRADQWALSGCVLGFVVASFLGPYPVPLIGYGASSIIGMAFGYMLLTPNADRRTSIDPVATAA